MALNQSRYDFSDPDDKQKIRNQALIIELWRDFILWLCEEECNSTVSEMEEQFKKWQDKQESLNTQPQQP